MRSERARLSRNNAIAKAMDYMLERWPSFTVRRENDPLDRFLLRLTLHDGRICLSNNAAERALRGARGTRRAYRQVLDPGGEADVVCVGV